MDSGIAHTVAMVAAVGFIALIAGGRAVLAAKIWNPSPPPPGEDSDSPREQGKRRVTPNPSRGDVDHERDRHDCTCGHCGPCQRAARVAVEVEPYDPDDDGRDDEDEPPAPLWRRVLGI